MSRLKKIYVQCSNTIRSIISHSFKKNSFVQSQSQKYILIPLFGMIGDAVLFLDALQGYQEFFSKEAGYHIVIACRPQIKIFLDNLNLGEEIEFIELDRGKMYEDAKEFPKFISEVSKYYYDLIVNVRARYMLEDVILYAIKAKHKVVFRNDTTEPESVLTRFFYHRAYDQVVYADPNSDQYGRYGKLLRVLGHTDYKSQISQIPQVKAEMIYKEPYCVVCPSSSSRLKCWPVDRFALVVDFIIENYSLDVCIAGSNADKEYSVALINHVKNKNNVVDFAGTTTMNGWIELIRRAEFVISNDSASVHIAAAVNRPSICISPQHDGERFFPYRPEVIRPKNKLPVTVRCSRVDCFDCQRSNRNNEAQADPQCQAAIKTNGVFRCINEIAVVNVCDAVQHLMEGLKGR